MRRNLFVTSLILAQMTICLAIPAAAAEPENDDLKKIVKSYTLRGTLESAIPQLEKFGGVKIDVDWAALKAAGVEKTDAVQLSGSDEKFIDIVDLLLAQVEKRGKPLAWRRDKSGLLQLTTQSNVLRRRFGAPAQAALPDQPARRTATGTASSEIRFDNVRLEDALETLRAGAGVNMFVNWSSLKTVGITRDTPITLRAGDISTARALDLVMLELNGEKGRMDSVYWVVDKGIVRVDTGEVLDSVMRTRVEDVADLLQITPNFASRRMKLTSIGDTANKNGRANSSTTDAELWEEEDTHEREEPEQESPAELRANQKNQLIESIKNSIGPDMWYPNGKGTITIFRNQLVITQSLLGWKLMERGTR